MVGCDIERCGGVCHKVVGCVIEWCGGSSTCLEVIWHGSWQDIVTGGKRNEKRHGHKPQVDGEKS